MRLRLLVWQMVCMVPGDGIAAEPTRVLLEAGELSHRLRAALLDELPATVLVKESEPWDLRVAVSLDEDRLSLEIADRRGALRLARDVPTTDGLSPALRVAVFLILKTIRDSASTMAPDRPGGPVIQPPAEPRDKERLEGPEKPAPVAATTRIAAQLGVLWWHQPFSAQPGLALAAGIHPGPWGVEARVMLSGVLCCRPTTKGMDLRVRELITVVRAQARIWRDHNLTIALHGGLGLNRLWLTAKPSAFVGSARARKVNALQTLGVMGVSLDVGPATWPVGLSAEAGLQVRFSSQSVMLPDAYDDRGVETGHTIPQAALGLLWRGL